MSATPAPPALTDASVTDDSPLLVEVPGAPTPTGGDPSPGEPDAEFVFFPKDAYDGTR